MTAHALDDRSTYTRFDSSDMLRHLHDIPMMCQDAWRLVKELKLPANYGEVNRIVVLGMGGSAIGADIVAGMNECRVPIIIQRGYDPPPFVDENTLVIASSYSGTTEETNAAFNRVLPGPAKKLVMTTGGTLKELAHKHHIPCFTFEYKAPPRAALPYSLIPCLGILTKLGFIDLEINRIEESISVLIELAGRINENQPFENNPAKNLAQELHDKICIVYGSEFLAEVGHRWKIQINENAKAWADYEFIPELNHNAVVGYRFPADVAARVMVVMLDSDLLNERIRQRYIMTCNLMKTAGVGYHVVSACKQSKLAQMLSLVMLGDYVSYYIALLNRTDPYPLDEVDYLKRELSSFNGDGNTKNISQR